MDENIAVSGTSFLINSEGNLLTNAHVVGSRNEMLVSFNGEEIVARVVATDQVNDLAVLSTSLKNKDFFKFSEKDVAREEDIAAIGYGFGKRYSSDVKATKGIVSALSGIANNYSHFQTDAAIQVGNSGGPILNNSSAVVGVAVAKLNTEAAYKDSGTIAENVNFAIKVSTVKQFLDSNNVLYELSENLKIDSKKRGEIIDQSVLYIFSKQKDKYSKDEPNVDFSIKAPVSGILELDKDKSKNKYFYDRLVQLKNDYPNSFEQLESFNKFVFEDRIINTDKIPLVIWGDDLKYHRLNTPEKSGPYKVLRVMSELNERVEKDQYIMILDKTSMSDEIMNARLIAPGKWSSNTDGWSIFCSNCKRSSLLAANWTFDESFVNEQCVYLECPNCNEVGGFSVTVTASQRRKYKRKNEMTGNWTKEVTADKEKKDDWGTYYIFLIAVGLSMGIWWLLIG